MVNELQRVRDRTAGIKTSEEIFFLLQYLWCYQTCNLSTLRRRSPQSSRHYQVLYILLVFCIVSKFLQWWNETLIEVLISAARVRMYVYVHNTANCVSEWWVNVCVHATITIFQSTPLVSKQMWRTRVRYFHHKVYYDQQVRRTSTKSSLVKIDMLKGFSWRQE